jgi:hypothetical protein
MALARPLAGIRGTAPCVHAHPLDGLSQRILFRHLRSHWLVVGVNPFRQVRSHWLVVIRIPLGTAQPLAGR